MCEMDLKEDIEERSCIFVFYDFFECCLFNFRRIYIYGFGVVI